MRRTPFTPRLSRAFLVRLLAVAVAVVTAQVVARDLRTLERRTTALGPLVTVVVAARDIPLGRVVTNADIETVERHRSQIVPGALASIDDAIGATAVVPLLDGTPVLADALAPFDREGTAALVPPGMQAIRIRADDAIVPEVGDVVDVLAATPPSSEGLGIDPALLPDAAPIEAATVLSAGAVVVAVDEPDDTSGRVERATAITVLVTAPQARQIASAHAAGAVTWTLDPPEDACCETG